MITPISEKKQPTCLQACCDRGQPGIAGGSFPRPWSWHQECNGTMLAWYDTGPKGMQRCRGLDRVGLRWHSWSKNVPSRRSLRRHLTLGILVRSRQSSANGGKKEAHSDISMRPQVVCPPLALPRSCANQAQGKGWDAWGSTIISSGQRIACPPLPDQTKACLYLWHYSPGHQRSPASTITVQHPWN